MVDFGRRYSDIGAFIWWVLCSYGVKSSTSAEKLLCMVKSYEYRYRAQDKPSQMQRRNRSILEGPRRMEWRLPHWLLTLIANCCFSCVRIFVYQEKNLTYYHNSITKDINSSIYVTDRNVHGKSTKVHIAVSRRNMYTVTLRNLFSKY